MTDRTDTRIREAGDELVKGACQGSENDTAPSRVACQETVRRERQSKYKKKKER